MSRMPNAIEDAIQRARKAHLERAWEYLSQDVRRVLNDTILLVEEIDRLRASNADSD